jgi:hypothetical protein
MLISYIEGSWNIFGTSQRLSSHTINLEKRRTCIHILRSNFSGSYRFHGDLCSVYTGPNLYEDPCRISSGENKANNLNWQTVAEGLMFYCSYQTAMWLVFLNEKSRWQQGKGYFNSFIRLKLLHATHRVALHTTAPDAGRSVCTAVNYGGCKFTRLVDARLCRTLVELVLQKDAAFRRDAFLRP